MRNLQLPIIIPLLNSSVFSVCTTHSKTNVCLTLLISPLMTECFVLSTQIASSLKRTVLHFFSLHISLYCLVQRWCSQILICPCSFLLDSSVCWEPHSESQFSRSHNFIGNASVQGVWLPCILNGEINFYWVVGV